MKINLPQNKRIALLFIANQNREKIASDEYKNMARKHPADFTRSRKMPFTTIIYFMLNMIKSSTQDALDHFFDLIGTPQVHVTQQSFSEARQNLNWEACRFLMDNTVDSIYQFGYSTWHGFRVSAVDGSKIQLPSDLKLKMEFGTTGAGNTAVTAQSSCLYDVLNDVILDAYIEPIAIDERTLAARHIDHLIGLPSFSKEFIIFDRGYPSFEMFELLDSKNVCFLMRVKRKFNLDFDKMPIGVHNYVMRHNNKEVALRIVKFKLPGGEIETLVTNLLDKRLGISAFKELYFLRRPIETKYGELKHKLEIENFSGRTELAIRQDYYITAFLSNIISVAANEAQPIIDEVREDTDNKYDYHVNKNHAVGVFKDRFILAMLEPKARKRGIATTRIIYLLTQHVLPSRPNRSELRNQNPRKANFHHNYKSNC